ncbi:gfo/Idh/MocA family oxidoreductase [Auraticoccus sp. F435]|uniref:Gfo/Idh/MocA family oxidoreductase n=1 Tax=Auraticoccus cholistanensis TaxID=2656650 RepID=A0A6A9UWN0_9ACTN|nr:Gfo/Idh/MocA family oxidoreductase [Auraticoccus cholistanensis]MVA77141.1 gfo/Idh/MocA family oxidoreductase [Auraticoccus cholistanensis]
MATSESTTTLPGDPAPPDELRVGVIGLGFAGTTHLDAFTALPGARVVALAGQEPARLAELADTRGVESRYADWQDLVARDDLDIVSIGVPNDLHHPIAVAALSSGKHVFCEKPLAVNGDLAQEMVDAARAADRVLEVAYNHRRRTDVQWLRRHLDSRPFGDIYHSRASWMRRTGIPGLGSWFTSRTAAGGGPLIDLGSHVLDIALFLLDEPRVTSVSAVAYDRLGTAGRGGSTRGVSERRDFPYEVEDFASALLRLDNGASLHLEASWASYSKADEDIEVDLLGATGGARLHVDNYSTTDTLTLYSDVAGAPTVSRPRLTDPGRHHQAVIAEFLAAIALGEQVPAGQPRHTGHYGEFALHRSRVLDAVYSSAAERREVEVVR